MNTTIEEWKEHWNAKSEIENLIELNGYCINGIPISEDIYYNAVVKANVDILKIDKNDKVLEVGCGSGQHLYEIEKYTNEIVGIDISEKLLQRYSGKAQTICTSADKLDFEEASFDKILVCSVVHYFPNREYLEKVIKDLYMFLKKDGLILISDLLNRKPHNKSKYTYFSKHEFVDILENLGMAYDIRSQNKLKRTINDRFDVIIYK